MTNTATTAPSRKALRHAEAAERSQAASDAYAHLVHLLNTDPKLAAIKGGYASEWAEDQAAEYERDADDERANAMRAGFDPERDL